VAAVYSHPKLPWNYFNHAVVLRQVEADLPRIARTIGNLLMERERPGCIELELDYHSGLPSRLLTTQEVSSRGHAWVSALAASGYFACDQLGLMGMEIEADSTGTPCGGARAETDSSSAGDSDCQASERRTRRLARGAAPPGFHLRPMAAREVGMQVMLHRAGFEVSSRPTATEQRLMRSNLQARVRYQWAVEDVSERPVGTAALLAVNGTAEIFAVAVVPGYRRRGLGAALVCNCLEEAAKEGCTLAYLETEMGSGASRLYEAIGFRPAWRRVTFLSA